jgi:hypothetical protein
MNKSILLTGTPTLTIDDADDYVSVEFSAVLKNASQVKWGGVAIRAILTDGLNSPISEYNVTVSDHVEPNELYETGGGFHMIDKRLMPKDVDSLRILVSATSLKTQTTTPLEMEIPEKPFVINSQPVAVDNKNFPAISIATWITEPDSDKEVSIELSTSYNNQSHEYIPELKIKAMLVSKAGNDLDEFDRVTEIPPFSNGILSTSTYSKQSKIKGGFLRVELSESRIDSSTTFTITA